MKNIRNQKGFTLIELMVSVAIMAILLTVVIANFGAGNQKRNLNIARNVMMSDLRKSQSLAIASKDVTPGHPANSYSATFSTSTNRSYSLIGQDNSVPPNITTLTSPNLPAKTYVKTISIYRQDGTTLLANNLTIQFSVPYGRIALSFDNSNGYELNDVATITLSTDDGANTVNVVANGVVGTMYTQ